MEEILSTEITSPLLPDDETPTPDWINSLLEMALIAVCSLVVLYAQEICDFLYRNVIRRERQNALNNSAHKLNSACEGNLDFAPYLDGTEASDEDLCSIVEVPATGSSHFNFLSPLSYNTPTPQKKRRYYKSISPFHSKNRMQPKPLTLIPEETASNLDDSQRQSPVEQLLSTSDRPNVSTPSADTASVKTEEDETTVVRFNATPPQKAASSSSYSGGSPTELFPVRRSSSSRLRKSVVSAATLRSKLKKSLPASAHHAVSSSALLSVPQHNVDTSDTPSRRRSHYGGSGRSVSLSQLERVIQSQEDNVNGDDGCFMIETTRRRNRRHSSASFRRSQSERHLKEDYRLLERMTQGRASVLPPATVEIGSPTALHSHPSDLSSTE